jgi:hypothetical protein
LYFIVGTSDENVLEAMAKLLFVLGGERFSTKNALLCQAKSVLGGKRVDIAESDFGK